MEQDIKKSRYIKKDRRTGALTFFSSLFVFSLYVMPQYFGLPTPVFDFTVLRMMLIIMLIIIFDNNERKNQFLSIIYTDWFYIIIPYMIVGGYTMVFRADIKSFLNPLLEFLGFFMYVYVIKYVLGIPKSLRYILFFLYILTFLGLIEYVIGETPFAYLETIKGFKTKPMIRSGQYRIMSSCVHSIAYGLLLLTGIPFVCLDYEKNEINIMKRLPLLLLIIVNVFLTGSRGPLALSFVEIFILLLCSKKETRKKTILASIFLVTGIIAFLAVFHSTKVGQYILMQMASVVDEVLGTEYAVMFGADVTLLGQSSSYRDNLKYIFVQRYLNPFIGQGRSRTFKGEVNGAFIESIDSFYVAEYFRNAYPGLITFMIFVLFYLKKAYQCAKKSSALCKAMLIGSVIYMIGLYTVDSLATLKYLYILFSYVIVWSEENRNKVMIPKKQDDYRKSKYIKS